MSSEQGQMTNGEVRTFCALVNGRDRDTIEAYTIITLSRKGPGQNEVVVTTDLPHQSLAIMALLRLAMQAEGGELNETLESSPTSSRSGIWTTRIRGFWKLCLWGSSYPR